MVVPISDIVFVKSNDLEDSVVTDVTTSCVVLLMFSVRKLPFVNDISVWDIMVVDVTVACVVS